MRGLAPQVTWGTNPGMVAPVDGLVPDPAEIADPGRSRHGRAGARLHGARAGNADLRDPRRSRLHRLVHERPHRRPAGRRRNRGRPPCPPVRSRDGRAGLCGGQAAGRGGGPRCDPRARRLRMAPGGLLDVPRHEPGRPCAGRAMRLHVEPQLRGPPGPGRQDAPRQPGDGGGGRARRPLRRHQGARSRAGGA